MLLPHGFKNMAKSSLCTNSDSAWNFGQLLLFFPNFLWWIWTLGEFYACYVISQSNYKLYKVAFIPPSLKKPLTEGFDFQVFWMTSLHNILGVFKIGMLWQVPESVCIFNYVVVLARLCFKEKQNYSLDSWIVIRKKNKDSSNSDIFLVWFLGVYYMVYRNYTRWTGTVRES